jgi:hypothetical protein
MSIDLSFMTRYGNIENYSKTMKMKQKWEKRQTIGDFKSKESNTVRTTKKTSSSQKTSDMIREMLQEESKKFIDAYKESQENDKSDEKLSNLRLKAMYGNDLSQDEMEYIRKKDPQFYQTIKAEKDELKSFEKKLKSAKTKEDAQRVVANEANAALSKVNAVTNNPHITEATKMSVCAAECRKLMKKQEVFSRFIDKGEYEKLPTEAEKHEAEKEIKDAREEELRNAGKTRETEESEASEEPKDIYEAQESYEASNTEKNSTSREMNQPIGDYRSHTSSNDIKDARKVTEKTEKSSQQAENSPESRKVKLAERKSRFGKFYAEEEASSTINFNA